MLKRRCKLAFSGTHIARDSGHILLLGRTSTGKSLLLRTLLPTVVLHRGHLQGKLVMFDFDGSALAWLESIGVNSSQVLATNPNLSIADSTLSLATDWATPDSAHALAELFVPETPGAKDPFWTQSAQGVASALIKTLQFVAGGLWDERDFIAIASDSRLAVHTLVQGPYIHEATNILGSPGQAAGCLGHLAAALKEHRTLANVAARTPGRWSIPQWLNDPEPGVLLLGADHINASAMKARNRLILSRVMDETLKWPETERERINFFIDEYPQLGRMATSGGGERLANYALTCRKIGARLVLCTQSVSATVNAYASREEAMATLDSCASKAFLSVTGDSYEYMQQVLGKRGRGHGIAPNSAQCPVDPSTFASHGGPAKARGIPTVAVSKGKVWSGNVPKKYLDKYLRPLNEQTQWLARQRKPAHYLEPIPFGLEDLNRLGIPPLPQMEEQRQLYGIPIPDHRLSAHPPQLDQNPF